MNSEEMEERFTQLQVCIDDGHSYDMDRESFDGESVDLVCTVCGYLRSVELTKEQAEEFDKLYDSENGLLKTILKNE